MSKLCRHFHAIRRKYFLLIALSWVLLQVSTAGADPADRLAFSGSVIMAPQLGIMSGKDSQLLFNYRGRLQTTAQIVPNEVNLIMTIEGGDGSLFLNETAPTLGVVNTIGNDADPNNIGNRPTLHFQKVHFYFSPLKDTKRTGKLEFSIGLMDQFEHFPVNEFGDVGIGNNNGILYEEKGFISCGFCITDVFTADLVAVASTVVGAAGRYQLPSIPVVVETGFFTTQVGNVAKTGQTNQRLFVGARAGCPPFASPAPVGCSDDFDSAYFQLVVAPKLFGQQGHFGAAVGGVRNGAVEDHIGKSLALFGDQFLPGNLIGFAQYQRAEKTPVNFAVTGNKEVVTAGFGWYSDIVPFVAKNYIALGYNRVAAFSNVETGFTNTGDITKFEHWFELFWRHQWAPNFEVTPHLTVVKNPGGTTGQKTLYIPTLRMAAFF
jgi:hypothetical protein